MKLETLQVLALEFERNDCLMSWDFMFGYRHFPLHAGIREPVLFHYAGIIYSCLALPFG